LIASDFRPRHFLLDFDGTLVDSAPLHSQAFLGALAEGAPSLVPAFDYARVRGRTTREALADLGVVDVKTLADLVAGKQARYRAAVAAGGLRPMPGARELLAWLRDRGHGLYLVTGGSAASVEQALAVSGLAKFFAGVVTGDTVARGKAAPDGYLACLARFDLAAGDCLAVEDAPSGVAACRAANIAVVGVFDPALRELADVWFPDLIALRTALAHRLFETGER
jgi:HAD superfamily hydrolase (TIGR01509 family)